MSISTPPRRRMFRTATSMFTRATWVQSRRLGAWGEREPGAMAGRLGPMPCGARGDGMSASPPMPGLHQTDTKPDRPDKRSPYRGGSLSVGGQIEFKARQSPTNCQWILRGALSVWFCSPTQHNVGGIMATPCLSYWNSYALFDLPVWVWRDVAARPMRGPVLTFHDYLHLTPATPRRTV